ncbi:hypothetical protein ACHAWF_003807 [Thalassiosira exigua]
MPFAAAHPGDDWTPPAVAGRLEVVAASASPDEGPASALVPALWLAPKPKRRSRPRTRPGRTATDKERRFVQHDYRDLSLEPDAPPLSSSPSSGIAEAEAAGGSSSPPKLAPTSFPLKLHRILSESERDGLSHVVGWQPHGRAFKIRDPAAFQAIVLPKYFPKISKLSSLQRQFNLYGFERLTRDGPDAGAYYHVAFLRYREELSAGRMNRQRIKGTGYKASSNPDAEPDLYRYPSMDEATRARAQMRDVATREALAASPSQGIAEAVVSDRREQRRRPDAVASGERAFLPASASPTVRADRQRSSVVTESSVGASCDESVDFSALDRQVDVASSAWPSSAGISDAASRNRAGNMSPLFLRQAVRADHEVDASGIRRMSGDVLASFSPGFAATPARARGNRQSQSILAEFADMWWANEGLAED